MGEYLMELRNVSKWFPGVQALRNVDFFLRPGSIHALVGENGAGKSTLMRCLFGLYTMDEGKIYLDGLQVNFNNPKQALENGVAMVHQELNQVLKRSAMENLWLGRFPQKGILVDQKRMYDDTKIIFQELGIDIDPNSILGNQSVSMRQMVEIAKAISYHSKVIVFDEPTSSLTEAEVTHLFTIIEGLCKNGCGIIYISHKIEEILRISDEVTIMRDGRLVSTTPSAKLTVNSIIQQMVGRELSQQFPTKTNKPGKVVMEVRGLCGEYNQVQDISFKLYEGEILGLAGLMGSGRTETLELLFGMATKKAGDILINGKEVNNHNPRKSMHNGFAFLTEERRATGVFGNMNVCQNTVIANLNAYRRGVLLSERAMNLDTDWAINTLRIKTPSRKTKLRSLSGGNQQKVIIGRWLLTKPHVLLLDEPTRGIDVGAKYEIYKLMLDVVNRGYSIIMVSSEMPELIGICDRIIVLSGGRISGEFAADVAKQEEILECAAKFV
jgi:methyl-galactoside transport system ATP-binding protein